MVRAQYGRHGLAAVQGASASSSMSSFLGGGRVPEAHRSRRAAPPRLVGLRGPPVAPARFLSEITRLHVRLVATFGGASPTSHHRQSQSASQLRRKVDTATWTTRRKQQCVLMSEKGFLYSCQQFVATIFCDVFQQ